ncbi:MAG TPA: CPBP family intramembrane glutamic endopeptidase [Armatimonadota bacterium]|nr:CPBP family intramembrane glutamic endopeptidase [Armatimonadota bacterium]
MWVILYLGGLIVLLLGLQTVVLLAFKEPLQWTFGANSQQPKSLKLALKLVLQGTLIGSIFLFPYLVGRTPASYYGPLFPPDRLHYFLYGEGIALALLSLIYAVELAGGWIYYKPRYPPAKALTKSTLSALSSLTVVSVEEPFFRGIVLRMLLTAVTPWIALPLSAVLFSGAHFIRKVKTYWPAVGLAVLGLWLGVAYYKTGNLWLSMGLHSGGILSIGVHRCFLNYRAGKEWLVGTQTFPIAGLISILIMLAGTAVTWVLFSH